MVALRVPNCPSWEIVVQAKLFTGNQSRAVKDLEMSFPQNMRHVFGKLNGLQESGLREARNRWLRSDRNMGWARLTPG